jgi:hypothetical protein
MGDVILAIQVPEISKIAGVAFVWPSRGLVVSA